MRQHVPQLTDELTNKQFLDLIVDCFHSVVFGTVDQNGDPHTNIIDIDFNEDGRLIFATTNHKNFYRNLKIHNRVSMTAMRGRESLSSIGFTLEGYVNEISPAYLDKIKAIKPALHRIYDNRAEDLNTLRPFALTPIIGSIYDLRSERTFQKQFDFVNQLAN
ncbi:pyridoxamine 5'-phosphate oxidase family protein [Lactobacillus kefiranofaciens]|uniref:pyridoxamine 5'-phosphate oxidase family protein n=1 Tax=Lactobacillus kefiranofaciens TaxID=267818 RepID=UPI002468FDAC|nr:pyridoxamine 5'-phosphate oxidase family protein [Lactobacillus kefiranofaciens]MDH5100078.1 pyridoxamine 5'-phosphate oxidase family protein [Lactobacillus kefiranofaciens]